MITLREASKIIPAVKMNERRGFLHAGHVLKPGRKSLKTTKQMCTGATYMRVYRKFLSRCHVVTAEAAAAVTGVTGVPEDFFPFPV